jgi:hypothetical protein
VNRAASVAHAIACDISRHEVDMIPLGTLVLDAVDAVARVVIALHRDRMAISEELADALGSVLVLHVAAALESRDHGSDASVLSGHGAIQAAVRPERAATRRLRSGVARTVGSRS